MVPTTPIEHFHLHRVASFLDSEGEVSARATFVGRTCSRVFVERYLQIGFFEGILIRELSVLVEDGLVFTVRIVRQPSEFKAGVSCNQKYTKLSTCYTSSDVR